MMKSNGSAKYGSFSRAVLQLDLATFGVSPAESRSMNAVMALALESGNAAF